MKLELLNNTKLKITFSATELAENGISVSSFLSGTKTSKKFINAILEIADEELNFSSKNHKIITETFSINNSNFIIYCTKESSTRETSDLLTLNTNSNILFYFKNLKSTLDFIKRLSYNFKLDNLYFTLSKYNNFYFFLMNTKKLPLKQIKMMQFHFLEEITPYTTSNILISKINEYSNTILTSENLNILKSLL